MKTVFIRILSAILTSLLAAAPGLLCYFGGTYEIMWLSIVAFVCYVVSLVTALGNRAYVWTLAGSLVVIASLPQFFGDWLSSLSNPTATWLLGNSADYLLIRAMALSSAIAFIFFDIPKISEILAGDYDHYME